MLGREYLEWLATLQPGDEVAVRQTFQPSQVLSVERVTPTQVLVGGRRYRRVPRRAGERVELAGSGKIHPVEQADRDSQLKGETLTTLRERTSGRSPEAMLDRALAEARRVAAETRGESWTADYADVAESLQGCVGGEGLDPDYEVEVRNAAAEGMIDALSGVRFEPPFVGHKGWSLRLALAYCGGYCLAAPGFGHASAVRAILAGELPCP
jgi:hypothetical protein